MAAKKLNIATLKKTLRQHFEGDAEKCKQINKMARGDRSDAPSSLMNLLVAYWKENYAEPPEIAN